MFFHATIQQAMFLFFFPFYFRFGMSSKCKLVAFVEFNYFKCVSILALVCECLLLWLPSFNYVGMRRKKKNHFAARLDFSSEIQGICKNFCSCFIQNIFSCTWLPKVGTTSNNKSYDHFPVEVISMQKWWCHCVLKIYPTHIHTNIHIVISLVVLWPVGIMKTISSKLQWKIEVSYTLWSWLGV